MGRPVLQEQEPLGNLRMGPLQGGLAARNMLHPTIFNLTDAF